MKKHLKTSTMGGGGKTPLSLHEGVYTMGRTNFASPHVLGSAPMSYLRYDGIKSQNEGEIGAESNMFFINPADENVKVKVMSELDEDEHPNMSSIHKLEQQVNLENLSPIKTP